MVKNTIIKKGIMSVILIVVVIIICYLGIRKKDNNQVAVQGTEREYSRKESTEKVTEKQNDESEDKNIIEEVTEDESETKDTTTEISQVQENTTEMSIEETTQSTTVEESIPTTVAITTPTTMELTIHETVETTVAEVVETTIPVSEEPTISVTEIDYPAGTILTKEQIAGKETSYFKISGIVQGDTIYNRINGKSYKENPNIGLNNLKYIKVLHYNFNHQIQVGEIIVNSAISNEVLTIFKELFEAEYEIQSMYLVDNYWTGDPDSTDLASMSANNTSAFNYREITSGGTLSNHAYGRAIDINPQMNPYIHHSNGTTTCLPSNGQSYIDRTNISLHLIKQGDICYSIFVKYGFTWGGSWENPIDYQHFEKR